MRDLSTAFWRATSSIAAVMNPTSSIPSAVPRVLFPVFQKEIFPQSIFLLLQIVPVDASAHEDTGRCLRPSAAKCQRRQFDPANRNTVDAHGYPVVSTKAQRRLIQGDRDPGVGSHHDCPFHPPDRFPTTAILSLRSDHGDFMTPVPSVRASKRASWRHAVIMCPNSLWGGKWGLCGTVDYERIDERNGAKTLYPTQVRRSARRFCSSAML